MITSLLTLLLALQAPGAAPTVRLLAPDEAMLVGAIRVEALTTGEVAEVRFLLDGDVVVQRRTSPFTADLFLGRLPVERVLEAVALDAEGTVVARDELVLNRRPNRFRVRFLRPSPGAAPDGSRVDVALDVAVPPGESLDRVELFLAEERIATLYPPELRREVTLPDPELVTYLRALAFLDDDNSSEAIVFVNADTVQEEISVRYVRIYASARERRSGDPVRDLAAEDVTLLEDGEPQVIRRFERVDSLPLHLAVLLDVSASMAPRMEASRRAAARFFGTTMLAADRATLVAFNDRPSLRVELTSDVERLALGLDGVAPMRGTALYDAVVFGLYQLASIQGQRALLVLSDGNDETSVLRFEDALDYARRIGIPVFPIRIGPPPRRDRRGREELRELAQVTGGEAFFIEDVDELDAVYTAISRRLRSRYLIAYQSDRGDAGGFREIELRSGRRGVTLSTVAGYHP